MQTFLIQIRSNKTLGSVLKLRVHNRKINFLFLNQNICCGYSKEPSQWDGSFDYPKYMLKFMGKKKNTLEIFVHLNLWGLIRIRTVWHSDGIPVFIVSFIYFCLFIFVEKVEFQKKSTDDKKHGKLPSVQRIN